MRAKIRAVVSAVVAAAILFTGCAGGFSSNKISKAAKKYGMQKARSVTEFVEITEDKQYSGGYYYVSKDSSEAFHLYNAYINPGKNGFPAIPSSICSDMTVRVITAAVLTSSAGNSDWNRR